MNLKQRLNRFFSLKCPRHLYPVQRSRSSPNADKHVYVPSRAHGLHDKQIQSSLVFDNRLFRSYSGDTNLVNGNFHWLLFQVGEWITYRFSSQLKQVNRWNATLSFVWNPGQVVLYVFQRSSKICPIPILILEINKLIRVLSRHPFLLHLQTNSLSIVGRKVLWRLRLAS